MAIRSDTGDNLGNEDNEWEHVRDREEDVGTYNDCWEDTAPVDGDTSSLLSSLDEFQLMDGQSLIWYLLNMYFVLVFYPQSTGYVFIICAFKLFFSYNTT